MGASAQAPWSAGTPLNRGAPPRLHLNVEQIAKIQNTDSHNIDRPINI